MEVDKALIDELSELARLEFSEAEKLSVKDDLQRMISFVEKLNEVDTKGIDPMLHMSDTINNYREDIIQGSMSREKALLNAPQSDGVFFQVPKVINK